MCRQGGDGFGVSAWVWGPVRPPEMSVLELAGHVASLRGDTFLPAESQKEGQTPA